MPELRRDFRRYYGCSFDECPTAEALDLARGLPMGSDYMGALDPRASWSEGRYDMARVIDLLTVIATNGWALEGEPARVARPADIQARAEAEARKARTRKALDSGAWEEVS